MVGLDPQLGSTGSGKTNGPNGTPVKKGDKPLNGNNGSGLQPPRRDEVVIGQGDPNLRGTNGTQIPVPTGVDPAIPPVPVNGNGNQQVVLIPFGEPLNQPQNPFNQNINIGNQDKLIQVGGYTVNQNTGELVGKSGFKLANNEIQSLIDLQSQIMQLEAQWAARGRDDQGFQVKISALVIEQKNILRTNFERSERKQELERLQEQNQRIENKIRNYQPLTTEELLQFVENGFQINKLVDAQKREEEQILKSLRIDNYNNKNQTQGLTREERNDYLALINQPPTPPGKLSTIETGQLSTQREVLAKKQLLEEKIKNRKATNEEKLEYYRVLFDELREVERPSFYKDKLRTNEELRNDFKVGFLVKDAKTPCKEVIEYFLIYENNITDPAKKALAGELITLAKKGLKLQLKGEDLGYDDKKKMQGLATQVMEVGDLRKIRNRNFDGKEFNRSALTGLDTAGSSFRGTKFKENTYFHESKFSDLSKARQPGNGESYLEGPEYRSDFTGAKMRGAVLHNTVGAYCIFEDAELVGADISNSSYQNADFTGAKLGPRVVSLVKLEHSNLSNSAFNGCDFTGAFLNEASCEGTSFQGSIFQNSDLERLNKNRGPSSNPPKTNFSGAVFKNSKASYSDFRGSDFGEAVIEKSELRFSDFAGSNLKGTVIINSSLESANFDEKSNLENAVIINSDLRRAKFKKTNLTGSDLNSSDLRGATLNGVKLNGANLANIKANGQDTTFESSDLSGSNLYKANLYGAKFSNAKLEHTNLQEVSADGANFEGANLTGAVLLNGHFKGANFKGADLTGVNIQGADLTSIQIDSKTSLSGAIYDDKTQFPISNNSDSKARADFAEKHGMIHIEQLELKATYYNAARAIHNIDSNFQNILIKQGWVSDTVNVLQNNIGSDGGWVFGVGFDTTRGSEHINNVHLKELRKDISRLGQLAESGFTKENKEEFYKLYKSVFGFYPGEGSKLSKEERMRLIGKPGEPYSEEFKKQAVADYNSLPDDCKLKKAIDAIQKDYVENKQAWGEGVSMAAGMLAFLGCLAAAPFTGGATLYAAPLVSASVSTGIKISNNDGVINNYSNQELATGFLVDVGAGYLTLPIGGVGGKVVGAGVQKGGGYLLSKVGGQTVARLATSRTGQVAGKFIVNSAVHATGGAAYSWSHGFLGSLANGDDLLTAANKGLEHVPEGALMGMVFGHAIDGAKLAGGHKGLKLYETRYSSSKPKQLSKSSSKEIKSPALNNGRRIQSNEPEPILARNDVTTQGKRLSTQEQVETEINKFMEESNLPTNLRPKIEFVELESPAYDPRTHTLKVPKGNTAVLPHELRHSLQQIFTNSALKGMDQTAIKALVVDAFGKRCQRGLESPTMLIRNQEGILIEVNTPPVTQQMRPKLSNLLKRHLEGSLTPEQLNTEIRNLVESDVAFKSQFNGNTNEAASAIKSYLDSKKIVFEKTVESVLLPEEVRQNLPTLSGAQRSQALKLLEKYPEAIEGNIKQKVVKREQAIGDALRKHGLSDTEGNGRVESVDYHGAYHEVQAERTLIKAQNKALWELKQNIEKEPIGSQERIRLQSELRGKLGELGITETDFNKAYNRELEIISTNGNGTTPELLWHDNSLQLLARVVSRRIQRVNGMKIELQAKWPEVLEYWRANEGKLNNFTEAINELEKAGKLTSSQANGFRQIALLEGEVNTLGQLEPLMQRGQRLKEQAITDTRNTLREIYTGAKAKSAPASSKETELSQIADMLKEKILYGNLSSSDITEIKELAAIANISEGELRPKVLQLITEELNKPNRNRTINDNLRKVIEEFKLSKEAAQLLKDRGKASDVTPNGSEANKILPKEKAIAHLETLGYKVENTGRTNVHGRTVYAIKNGSEIVGYISYDIGSGNGEGAHNGGIWKKCELNGDKFIRTATLDKDLNVIAK